MFRFGIFDGLLFYCFGVSLYHCFAVSLFRLLAVLFRCFVSLFRGLVKSISQTFDGFTLQDMYTSSKELDSLKAHLRLSSL